MENLIRYPLEDNIGFIALVDKMGQDPLLKTVNAARVSYDARSDELSDKDRRLLKFLREHDHGSPWRHSYFTFHVKAPLFVFRQWIKYQVGCSWRSIELDGNEATICVFDLMYDNDRGCSWNEISGRYAQFKPEFFVPSTFRTNPGHGNKQRSAEMPKDFDHEQERDLMIEQCGNLYEEYLRRIDIGIAREQARMMLPQNIYTQAYWTVSLAGVLHMLDQRLHHDAQWEIQQYARGVYDVLCMAVPALDDIYSDNYK